LLVRRGKRGWGRIRLGSGHDGYDHKPSAVVLPLGNILSDGIGQERAVCAPSAELLAIRSLHLRQAAEKERLVLLSETGGRSTADQIEIYSLRSPYSRFGTLLK
jgi:hypothetical protein